MYILDILLDGRLLVAMAIFGLLAAGEPFFEAWTERFFYDNPPARWSWRHLGAPLLRALLILGFVCVAYPAFFGLREAPSISTLFGAEEARASTVLGALYLLALLAPVLPVLYRHPEFVLPMQGILATAFLFKWMTSYLMIDTIGLWPGIDIATAIVLTSYLAHRIGRRLGAHVGDSMDKVLERSGYDAVLTHVASLVAQLPVVVIYAAGLARQIAI